MCNFFENITKKLTDAAKEHNFLFSIVNLVVAGCYFTLFSYDKLIEGLLVFLLFNYLIVFSAFGRVEKEIEESDLETINKIVVKLSVFKIKPMLILIMSSIISCYQNSTESVIIKIAIIFVASVLLTEGWIREFKKQILSQVKEQMNEV